MMNKLRTVNKIMVVVLSVTGLATGGVVGTKHGLDYREQKKEERAIALDKQMAKAREEAGTKVKFELPQSEIDRREAEKKEKEEKLRKEEEAKKQAEIKKQQEIQAKKEEERLEQERQAQQAQEEQARLEEEQAQQQVVEQEYVEPVQEVQEVAQTQQAVQPVNVPNTHINGMATQTQSTYAVDGFGTENILYKWEEMPNWYLAERISSTGQATRGLYQGAEIKINGRSYYVTEIIRGVKNDRDASLIGLEGQKRNGGGITIQTCETASEDSTLMFVFAV